MKLFGRRRNLPDLDALADAMKITTSDLDGQILANASGTDLQLAALRSALAVWSAGAWEVIPWELIQAGKWDGKTSTLSLTLLDGAKRSFELEDAGLLPQVFRERVQASIVVEQRLPAPGGELLISGRRSLSDGPNTDIIWHALALGRTRLDDPGVGELALRVTEQLRLDYDM